MGTGRLIHYSKTHLSAVHSVPIEKQDERGAGLFKPRGLWVSVEGKADWAEWCRAENFGCLDCATEVVLAPEANVLRLKGADDLDRFHASCSVVRYRYGEDLGDLTTIDWRSVAQRYQGIIIAPYVWQRRLDRPVSNWYYGWDCASGCIWDAAAVARLRPIETSAAVERTG